MKSDLAIHACDHFKAKWSKPCIPSKPDYNKELVPPIPALILGGADRVRTDDFRLAKAALSQLSYSPEAQRRSWWA